MLISDITNNGDLLTVIISELRDIYGIKYRKEKNHQKQDVKANHRKIFNSNLAQLELTDVVLTNGRITQVPVFVSDACQCILEQVSTEGLFRKAGSTARQREIKAHLDSGFRLEKKHHVIDVANVLKLFFRELREPLLPPGNIQETILRSLLIKSNEIDVLMLACLLLPPLSLNTLMFFMQFLHTISMHSDANKMTTENLAIIFAPGLMPLNEMVEQRLNCHVKIIEMLIRNSNRIGIIPKAIVEKLNRLGSAMDEHQSDVIDKKKKKRRSGSLTRMFNGIRKMIGAKGSAENLDKSGENNSVTPCISKSAKKRKVAEVSAFSAKKKLNVLNLLPDNGSILPSTPVCIKDNKRSRMSVGGKRHMKQRSSVNNLIQLPQIERRWSVVGTGWNKKKLHCDELRSGVEVPLSPIISLPILPTSSHQVDLDLPIENSFSKAKQQSYQSFLSSNEDDFVRVPKIEYEEIKERVFAIETRISQEFGNVRNEILSSEDLYSQNGTNLENVLNKYEKTREGTELLNSPTTDSLVVKMGKDLKIRSAEDKIIRSPSARKIGTLRRRSRENVVLSRNESWYFGHKQPTLGGIIPMKNLSQNEPLFYSKVNLKRGRPNTVQTGLCQPSPKESLLKELDKAELKMDENNFSTELQDENWINGEQFFSTEEMQHPLTPTRNLHGSMEETPRFVNKITLLEMKTPMLPPKRSIVPKTPSTLLKSSGNVPQKQNYFNKSQLASVQEQQTGRASIARLRSQNAGMVAAKAKLFDDLVSEIDVPPQKHKDFSLQKNKVAQIHTYLTDSPCNKQYKDGFNNYNKSNRSGAKNVDRSGANLHKSTPKSTPRRHRNNHGINRRQKLRHVLSPNKNSPRLTKKILNNELANHIDRDMKYKTKLTKRIDNCTSPDVHYNRTFSQTKEVKSKITPVKLRSSPRLQVRSVSNQVLSPHV